MINMIQNAKDQAAALGHDRLPRRRSRRGTLPEAR